MMIEVNPTKPQAKQFKKRKRWEEDLCSQVESLRGYCFLLPSLHILAKKIARNAHSLTLSHSRICKRQNVTSRAVRIKRVLVTRLNLIN
jgi:hypothetical protein